MILVVYNITGISKRENLLAYCRAIEGILDQDCEFDLVISGCCSSPQVKAMLKDRYSKQAAFSWVDKSYPLPITCNKAIQETNGKYEGFLYIACDVMTGEHPTVFSKMLAKMKSGPYGIVSPRIDNDSGYPSWGIQFDGENDVDLPVGKAVNGHCFLFSESLARFYGWRVFPDIFCNHTSESIMTHMAAALNLKWAILGGPLVHHQEHMDGPSSGWMHKFLMRPDETMHAIYERGKALGFGWEECNPSMGCMHDPSKFDQNGFAIDARLKHFIRDNCFLRKEEFDYKQVPCVYEPRRVSQ